MNTYGRQAQEAWRSMNPARYYQLRNPEEFFTKLGDRAQEQVDILQFKLSGPDPQWENPLERAGRLQAARNGAEEMVRYELLSPPALEGEDEAGYVNPSIQLYLDSLEK